MESYGIIGRQSNITRIEWIILFFEQENMRARQNLAGENIDENIALRFPVE